MTEGMELQNQEKIKTLGEKETYRYLGILKVDTIKQEEMKETIKKECLKKTRKLLETKLNSRNLLKGINTWAVSLERYSRPFLEWTSEKLKQMNKKVEEIMTMHQALHSRDDAHIRKEGGWGLASTEDNIDASIQWLVDYLEKRGGSLIRATWNNTDGTKISRTQITRKQKEEENNFMDVLSD